MPALLLHEQKAHFQAKRRERAAMFAKTVRHDLERSISALSRGCETEEERRDVPTSVVNDERDLRQA